MNVIVVMTGDEEDSGDPQTPRARGARGRPRKGADYALGFEDGPGDPRYAVTARRGTSSWTLQRQGDARPLVADFRPDVGYGAIYEAARILDGFRAQARRRGAPHVQSRRDRSAGRRSISTRRRAAGTAFGKANVVAERAVVTGDLRTLSKDTARSTRAGTMQAVVAASLPQTEATLTFDDGYPSLAPTEGNARLLAVYDRASQRSRLRASGRRQPRSRRRGRRLVRRRPGAEHHRRHRPDGTRRSHRQPKQPISRRCRARPSGPRSTIYRLMQQKASR